MMDAEVLHRPLRATGTSRGVAAVVLNVQYYVLLPLDPTETLELFHGQQGKDSTGHWEIYQSAKAISEAFSNIEIKRFTGFILPVSKSHF